MKLHSRTREKVLVNNLQMAETFVSRGVGLLSRKGLSNDEALMINPCNSIHTFFMRFSIDCVFLDSEMRVRKILHDVKPWRMTMPVWGARLAVEMPAGRAASLGMQEGEVLYVGAANP